MKAALCFILVIGLIGCIPHLGDNQEAHSFDKKLWHNRDSIDYNVRYQMLADLRQKCFSLRKKRVEVIELLGAGDIIDLVDTQNSLTYEVGNNGFDPCYLTIEFGSTQHISAFRVTCY